MKSIPLFKVLMSPAAAEAVAATLSSGYIGQGPRVERFEQALGKLLDAHHPPLATNSCTSALDLALHLCGVGPDDEVISTPITCAATNTVIVRRHARIVWADVDPHTGLIDPADVKRKLTPMTKAIVAVDWGGAPCDYAALEALGPPVIEDAAHAFGARIDGRSIAESKTRFICWSFGPIKHLTCGDGGALLTPPEYMERARLLRWYGLDRRSSADFRTDQRITEAGYKYHMNDIAASIGLGNLEAAARAVHEQRQNAAWYAFHLDPASSIKPDAILDSAWWLYTLRVAGRDDFMAHMKGRGIETSRVHVRNDLHPALRGSGGPLPGVNEFDRYEVAIPVGWWLTPDDRERIAKAFQEFVF